MPEQEVMQNFKEIYAMLKDDLSRELYVNRLAWLVTGDFGYVEKIVKKSHPNMPVWKRGNEEDFILDLPPEKGIVCYGAGSFAKRMLPYMQKHFKQIVFCDASREKQANGYYGYSVCSPEEAVKNGKDKSFIICTTKYTDEVKEYLLSNGVLQENIVDIRQYFCCGTGDEYFYEDFLKFSNEEIFIDAGCCDLGTTADFFKVCQGLKKAYAFEPDAFNYKKCRERLEREQDTLPEVVMLPYGTWSSSTKLHFNATGDGCAHIGDGETVIQTIAIDDAVDGQDKITFIKMDVEGAELESLKGAQTVIKRDKPKLAVCIYHKPEDILTLPLFIKKLVPEYKFYLRSYSNADNEMVLYAIP